MAGFDLGQVGYTLEEFFLESTATRFEPVGPAGADGPAWLEPATPAAPSIEGPADDAIGG